MKDFYTLEEVVALCCKAYRDACMNGIGGFRCEDGKPIDLIKWLEDNQLKKKKR